MDAIRENIKELYKCTQDNKKYIERVEQKADVLHDLTTSVKLLGREITSMREDTNEIKRQVNEINDDLLEHKMTGSQKWDKFVWWVFIFILGYVANAVLLQLGG